VVRRRELPRTDAQMADADEKQRKKTKHKKKKQKEYTVKSIL
jgi:hypothetical protein